MPARNALLALLLCSGLARAADDTPPSLPDDSPQRAEQPRPAGANCDRCAIVRAIRAAEHPRSDRRHIPNYMASEQYLATRRYSEPYVGPVVGMTFGPGQETRRFAGAAGSNTMRQSVLEIVYEITVRFDDGRDATIEQDRLDGIRVGDRVEMVDQRLQLAPR